MDQVESRNLFQEIDSYEESPQGFCNLIANLSYHPCEDDTMEMAEQTRESVIVRNDVPLEDEDRAQKEGRPVLTYLGRPCFLLQHNYNVIVSFASCIDLAANYIFVKWGGYKVK